MRILDRILEMSRVRDEEIVRMVNLERKLFLLIQHSKMGYLEHILRGSRNVIYCFILKGQNRSLALGLQQFVVDHKLLLTNFRNLCRAVEGRLNF